MDIRVQTIRVGAERTNCYIVSDDKGNTFVVDPGAEADKIINLLQEIKNIDLKFFLLTHGHFDHIGAVDGIKKVYPDCIVYLPENDEVLYCDLPEQGAFVGRVLMPQHSEITAVSGGQFIKFGDEEIEIVDTPGHTPGGVCYLLGYNLFTGDTLFFHTYGRVDLPLANPKKMEESLDKLLHMSSQLTVYPGHGQSTTIAEEKAYNKYY